MGSCDVSLTSVHVVPQTSSLVVTVSVRSCDLARDIMFKYIHEAELGGILYSENHDTTVR